MIAKAEGNKMRNVTMTTVKKGNMIFEMNVLRIRREKATPVTMYASDTGAQYSAVFFIVV